MKKIIKNGRRALYFVCKKCGCEFLSDEYGFIQGSDRQSNWDTPDTSRVGDQCPNCGRYSGNQLYKNLIKVTDEFLENLDQPLANFKTAYNEEGMCV